MRNFIHCFGEGGGGSEGAHSTNYRDLAVWRGPWVQHFFCPSRGYHYFFLLYKLSITDEDQVTLQMTVCPIEFKDF